MDTVLWGGISFLIAVGIAFFLMAKVDKSTIADRHKRVINYFILASLTALAFLIFHWHSTNYMAGF